MLFFVCLIAKLWKALVGGTDSFEWRVYVVHRCVSAVDDSNGVRGCWWVLVCCVWGRVEEGMVEKACFVVGCMFDHIIASSLFLKR